MVRDNIRETIVMVYCGICNGDKTVKECVYRCRHMEYWMQLVYTGGRKDCPGCDGTGFSKKARLENMWSVMSKGGK